MWWFSWGWAACFHACGPKNPINLYLLPVLCYQSTGAAISHVHCTEWQVHWNMHKILRIQSIFRGPTSAKRNMPVCPTGFVSRAGWDRCELGLDKCILFLQRGRPTLFDRREMVAPNPKSAVMRGRGRERYVWDWMRGMRRKVVRSRCDPLSSLCLNKSCSRSFYLHMLTGTSEFPEETCREKKVEEKNRGREPERAVPIDAPKGLSGLFSGHGAILQLNSLFLIHTCT